MQNLPFGMDRSGGTPIPQPSGVNPGNRTVVATLDTAQVWAWRNGRC